MNHSDEFKNLFEELKNVERSDADRMRSLNALLNYTDSKTKFFSRRFLVIPITSIISFSIIFFLFFSDINDNAPQQSSANENITITLVTVKASKTDELFELSSTSPLNVIEIKDDSKFFHELKNVIVDAEPIANLERGSANTFDIGVTLDQSKQIKLELWGNEKGIYFYHFEEDTFYFSDSRSALNLYSMLLNLPTPD
ncbi:hypothetical protein [Jeotgalibacillus aurantiacus]|uniref:hypothetical protein n=1 Tax=Jeotgalibacillus aurantiacus TaxID=2763266 RepID=UPI001D09F284|nr:hypothetical protein [Jeotgalibacillus aurantiacus]